MTAANLNIFYRRRKFFCLSSGLTIGLVLLYFYLVNSTVFALVAREKLALNLIEKQNTVIALETEYLSFANNLTMKQAVELGFRDATRETIFVHAPSLPVLSYAGR